MAGDVVTVAVLLARAGIPPSGAFPALDPDLLATPVSDVCHDSRRASGESVFVAVPGAQFNGTRFAGAAAARGALFVVSQTAPPPDPPIPWVRVPDARVALSALAAAFHGNPSHDLLVVGVTGTNGKTTTTYLIESVLEQAAIPTGRICTVANRIGRGAANDLPLPVHTTPEAPDVHRMLRGMRGGGNARLRPGDIVARPCTPPGGPCPLHRRRVHQPDARSP